MDPSWKTGVLENTPQEFKSLMHYHIDHLSEEFDIFLKMGFTKDELTIEIDDTEQPHSVHVILKKMDKK